MEHEPEESPAGTEPVDEDDDERRRAAGWVAGTAGTAAFGGTVAGGIAASGGSTDAAATAAAAPASPPLTVHGSPSAGQVHGSPGAPVHGSPPSTVLGPRTDTGPGVHGDPLTQAPSAAGGGPGVHGDPLTQAPPTAGGGPGVHGEPLSQPPSTAGRINRWIAIVGGAVVVGAVAVGVVVLAGGDDDTSNEAVTPTVAEPASPTDGGLGATETSAAPQTAPGVAGTTAIPAVEGGTVTFVVAGGLQQSADLSLMSTVPTEGGQLFNYANATGDQVLQIGVLVDQTIVSYTDSQGIVAGSSDQGCTFEFTYDGDVLIGGTFTCIGIPGVAGGNPITADVSGTFVTGN